nr:MAG TPA: hypothetical protein [Caudoviricetes sp.]
MVISCFKNSHYHNLRLDTFKKTHCFLKDFIH